VAPAPDGTVWYTGQNIGVLGRLDPVSGDIDEIPLGNGSAPHGVIIGPDGAAWVTDSGLNAIVRVDPDSSEVEVYPLPGGAVNLNTAVFDHDGILWFTGQSGVFGRLDPASPDPEVFEAPGGGGPYGITVTPNNEVFYASLAGNHIARIDKASGTAERIDPPTPGQGSRRVWSDSNGVVWVSEWEAGQVGAYDAAAGTWREWVLPGDAPQAYAVYVDETNRVWLTDFAGDGAVVRFDPTTEGFESFPLPSPVGNVRQLLGRPGEVWGAESAADALIVFRYGT
jgi:virginiamycin B lyase